MKKKLKIFLSVFILIVAAGAGTVYYLYQTHQYKNDDKKLTKIVDSGFKINLPDSNDPSNTGDTTKNDGASDQSDNSKNSSENSGNTASGQATSTATNQSSSAYKDSTISKGKTKVTAASIIDKYMPSFKDLEAQASSKVDSLTAYAISDYKTRKANSENPSYIYFYSKYSTAGHVLEASTDTAFSTIYNALTTELKQNGFSASEAQDLKDQYNQMKKNQQSALISKAMDHLK